MLSLMDLLQELKQGLRALYKDQLVGMVLFGSYARGDYDEDSDVDILIILNDFAQYGEELRRTSDLIGNMSLKFGVTVSVVFVRQAEWVEGRLPLWLNIHAEGVPA